MTVTKGYRTTTKNRHFENDYRSLKQFYGRKATNEIVSSIVQTSTNAQVVLEGSDVTIATLITAEEVVFLETEVDDANQDLASVWVTYQDDTGLIKGPILHLLNDTATTTIPAPLGNEDVFDTIASGQGTTTCTLTALAGATLDQYKGLYVVIRSGTQVRDVHLITGSSLATPTVLTLNPALGAAADADVAQIQTYPCEDFFRLREMWCEVEPLTTKQITLCDHNGGNVYNAISMGGRYSAHSGLFTQPKAICKSFLGKIHAQTAQVQEGDTVVTGTLLSVTFTPVAKNSDGDSADITLIFQFSHEFNWEPCIELEEATDVILKIADLGTATEVHVETSYLEVYVL